MLLELPAFIILASLVSRPQERIEDNAWLRYKPGTWIKSKMTIETPSNTIEEVQTLTLAEVNGDDYVVQESYKTPGSKTSKSKRSRGVTIGKETLTVAGKAYDCKVNIVKGTNDDGPTEGRFWTPVGSKNAVKIAIKQKGVEGELLATAIDEKVTALGKTLVCNKLQGKLKFGDTEGVLEVVLCEDIPGAQVRADLVLKGQDGDTKIKFEAIEILEKLKNY
jgi:hypothetical protein